MPKIECYKCPHCEEVYFDRGEYRKHVLDKLIECADTINALYKDAQGLNIGFGENFSHKDLTRYYEAKDLGDEQ